MAKGRVLWAIVLAAALVAVSPAGAGMVATAGATGDVVTTVDFEGYPVGTQVTNQYAGITFEYATAAGFNLGVPADGVAFSGSGGPPLVVGSGAHGGSHAAEMQAPVGVRPGRHVRRLVGPGQFRLGLHR